MNASLISGLSGFYAIAVSGSDLFVSTGFNISKYTTSGALVNASLLPSASGSFSGIAVSGSDLFVMNEFAGTISKYTTSGVLVNASLISGLNDPIGIAIGSTVPEPGTGALSLLGIALLGLAAFKRKLLL